MYNNMDAGVVPLVRYFNQQGLKTSMSCQGHNSTNMSMFWIEFAADITSEAIAQFMKHHLDESGNFCSSGWFSYRLFVYDEGHIYLRWCYTAATQVAADSDLHSWEDLDAIKH